MREYDIGMIRISAQEVQDKILYTAAADTGAIGEAATIADALRLLAGKLEAKEEFNAPLCESVAAEAASDLAKASREQMLGLQVALSAEGPHDLAERARDMVSTPAGRALLILAGMPVHLASAALALHNVGLWVVHDDETLDIRQIRVQRARRSGDQTDRYVYDTKTFEGAGVRLRILSLGTGELASSLGLALIGPAESDGPDPSVEGQIGDWGETVDTFISQATEAYAKTPGVRWKGGSAPAVLVSYVLGVVRHMVYRGTQVSEHGDDPWYALGVALLHRVGIGSSEAVNSYPKCDHDKLEGIVRVSEDKGSPAPFSVRGPSGVQ